MLKTLAPSYTGATVAIPEGVETFHYFKTTNIAEWSLQGFLAETGNDEKSFLASVKDLSKFKAVPRDVRLFAHALHDFYSGTFRKEVTAIAKDQAMTKINRFSYSVKEKLLAQKQYREDLEQDLNMREDFGGNGHGNRDNSGEHMSEDTVSVLVDQADNTLERQISQVQDGLPSSASTSSSVNVIGAAGQKRLGAVRVEPEEAPLIAQHSALAAPLPPTAAIPKMSVAGDTVASMRAGEAGPSDAGAVLPPPSNASTTPPETPPSFAASPSCLGSPPAYFGAVNPSNTAATDSTASNITTGLPSDMNPDTSPGPAEMAPTAPPPDDQSTINNEERTILLSEIEKITHTCQPQEGEACLTCHFKRYQRLCVDALLNTELKIAEIADVVSLIGIFVPSRPTERMKSVFSDEELEALIRSGEVTHEEWDSVEFDTLLPMKAVRLCLQNRMEDVAATLAPLNKDNRPIRIMLETLLEYLPRNEDRSISEYDYSVKHIGPVLQAFFQSKSATTHFPNKDSATQKKLGLRPDRPDFTVTVDKTEIAWGEISGPAHENDNWKNLWDFFRDLRYGKAFLDSGFRMAPLFHIVYEVGTYMRLQTETRGMYVLHEVGKFTIPTTTATVGTLIATFPTLFIAKRDIGNIAKGPLNVLKRSWGYQDLDKSKMALVQRSSGQKKQKSTPNDPANPQQNNDDRQDDAVQSGYLSVADLSSL